MDFLVDAFDYLRHFDAHLKLFMEQYGPWVYALLFAIIFAETGLVVTPFLPGDSLLFATGALAAGGGMNPWILWGLLFVAAVLGDTVNYAIGARLGTRVFKDDARILKTAYLRKTEAFYAKHGGKTIILARFMPIVRTYAPFVAGCSRMDYGKFLTFNIVGGFVWITMFLWAGYLFGNVPIIKNNFELVVVAIIILSVLPGVYEYWKHKRADRNLTTGSV